MCDLETSTVRQARTELGYVATKKKYSDTSANEDNSFRNHIR